MIGVVDYGMGNLRSVKNALDFLEVESVVSGDVNVINECEKIILPGVGAFGDAADHLNENGMMDCIRAEVASGKPLLGICLGMQLLFEGSEESPERKGLGLLEGTVKHFKGCVPADLKIPHMGWNSMRVVKADCPVLKDIKDESFFYFVHSFFVEKDREASLGITDYGVEFSAMVWKENVYGAQFHPEKSQNAGLMLLKNFVSL